MEARSGNQIRSVWSQDKIPVIYRQSDGKGLLVKLPYAPDNKLWLQGEKRNIPKWHQRQKYWETPKAWFNDLVSKCLKRHKRVYIIQPYRKQEVCAPACMNALGHECQCSCMGVNHGAHNSTNDWFVVSDAFATRWRERELAC